MPTDETAARTTNEISTAERRCVLQYEIRVDGHLGSRWADWFDGLSLTNEDDGTSLISGPVVDQAALHGLLAKLRDLGIPLVSVIQLSVDAPAEPAELPDLRNSQSSHNPSGATS